MKSTAMKRLLIRGCYDIQLDHVRSILIKLHYELKKYCFFRFVIL